MYVEHIRTMYGSMGSGRVGGYVLAGGGTMYQVECLWAATACLPPAVGGAVYGGTGRRRSSMGRQQLIALSHPGGFCMYCISTPCSMGSLGGHGGVETWR